MLPTRNRSVSRRLALGWAAAAAVGAIGLGALVAPMLQGSDTSPAEPASPSASDSAQAANGPWTMPEAPCASGDVLGEVQQALAGPVESVENSLLATPDEVAPAARARQAAAWHALDADELAFQHCLRSQQGSYSG